MDNLIDAVCEWGSHISSGSLIRDITNDHFDSEFTASLTRHLREAEPTSPAVSGDRRNGYELVLPDGQCLGVSRDNGTTRFHVYYRPANNASRLYAERMYQLAEAA